MTIETYRSSFSVFVADSHLDRGREVTQQLALLGYAAEQRVSRESLFEELKRNPPHNIMLHFSDEQFFPNGTPSETIDAILGILPETHIFIFAKSEELSRALELYENGVYDVLVWPTQDPIQIVKAVDRSAQTDYQVYRNEQLLEKVGDRAISSAQMDFGLFQMYLKGLDQAKDRDDLMTLATRELARRFQTDEGLYLRYVPGAGTLVVAEVSGLSAHDVEGVGIDLRKQEPGFVEEALLRPRELRSLRQFVQSGLLRKDFVAYPYRENGIIRGVFVVPSRANDVYSDSIADDPYAHMVLKALANQLEFRDLKSRLERLSVYDDESESLKTEYFLKKVREEVSRARRIAKPVAMILMSIDGIQDMRLEQTPQTMEQFLRAFVQILVKNSRLNDFLGRVSDDQFGLILPHTDKRGGAIKAERIRRIIESADFSQILVGRKKLTISVGVSEYPSVCSDSDDLLKTSEEAMNEVRRFGNNRVCLATPAARFVPDFIVGDGSAV